MIEKELDSTVMPLFHCFLLAQQRPTSHYLKKQLITDLPYDSRDINDIIRALQSTYRCIGITCDEVGSPRDVDAPICERQSELAPLAGYTPTTDVREVGK